MSALHRPSFWVGLGFQALAVISGYFATVNPQVVALLGGVTVFCFFMGWALWARWIQVPLLPDPDRAIRFDAPKDAELAIYLEPPEFHPFRDKAVLLEAKIRVENKTAKTKYIRGLAWQVGPSEDGRTDWYSDPEVGGELHAMKERRPELHYVVEPHATTSGWVHVALPHEPSGGVGSYTLRIEDEVGTEYVLEEKRRGERQPYV